MPPRALTMLSSRGVVNPAPSTISPPKALATKPPAARAESAERLLAMLSSRASPCAGACLRGAKVFARFRIAALFTPRPSSDTLIVTESPAVSAHNVIVASSDFPASRRSEGVSTP